MAWAARIPQLSGGSSALADLNFTANSYSVGSSHSSNPANLPGWSFSRASTGTAVDSQGNIISFGSGVPRITNLGLLIEESRTNSFLNSAVGVTQAVTTTAASWTLSFYGTGSITLTGGATGTLAGTGANNRVTLTVTATAASTTLTVTGSTTNVQFEAGASASSVIPTTGATATRAADVASIANFTFPVTGTVLADYIMPLQPTSTRGYLHFVNEATNSRFAARGADASNPQPSFIVGDGTTTSTLQPYAATTGQLVKTAMAYDTTSAQFGAAVNGTDATAARQVTASILINATYLIGSTTGGGGQLNSYVKRLVVQPTFYSSAQRISATQ